MRNPRPKVLCFRKPISPGTGDARKPVSALYQAKMPLVFASFRLKSCSRGIFQPIYLAKTASAKPM
jgi:hypothetical protein